MFVFDDSQTEDGPLAELAKVKGDTADNLARLEKFYAKQDLTLSYSPSVGAGA